MTTSIRTRLRRSACLGLATGLLLMGGEAAVARDDGVLQFFSSMLGGAGAHEAPQADAPADADGAERPLRPLTVRPRSRPRLAIAALPVKSGPVAIFEDRTLRRGDAVMTAEGLRIFAGSSSWPYTRADFVALSQSGHDVGKTVGKDLAEIDRGPRP